MNPKLFYTAIASCSLALFLSGGIVRAAAVNESLPEAAPPAAKQPAPLPQAPPPREAVGAEVTGINTTDLKPDTVITLTGDKLDRIGEISISCDDLNGISQTAEILNGRTNTKLKFVVPDYDFNCKNLRILIARKTGEKDGVSQLIYVLVDPTKLKITSPVNPMPKPNPPGPVIPVMPQPNPPGPVIPVMPNPNPLPSGNNN
jgi:hypothetical protein